MRRAILAVCAGGLLLSSAACSDDPKTDEVAAPAATTVSATPSVTVSATPDYTAANKVVCERLDEVLAFRAFGEALGKMLAYKDAKDTANADKAEKQAATELKAVGTRIRKETQSAVDPELKTLASASAQQIEASAADPGFIEAIKSPKDLDSSLKDQITDWIGPLAGHCGVSRGVPESPSAGAPDVPTTIPSASATS